MCRCADDTSRLQKIIDYCGRARKYWKGELMICPNSWKY